MRRITFIKSLNVESLPMLNLDEVRYHTAENIRAVSDEEYLETRDYSVETHIVPVHMLRTGNEFVKDTLYIAYSKKVQDLLGMPFDVMKKQLDEQSEQIQDLYLKISRIRHAKFWKRVRFLFLGFKEFKL